MRNKMIRKVLIVLTLVSYAVSDSCVRYTFEEDFNELFTRQRGWCVSSDQFWVLGKYNDIELSNENDQNTTFITPVPLPAFSCVSSFSFPMAPGGTIEVNTYMETSTSNYIMIGAYQLGDKLLGYALHDNMPGWSTLKIILSAGAAIGDGYISILGMASPNSIILVDSFRYIPSGMEESACQLYEDKPEPVPSTPEPTTLDPTSPEETTSYPPTQDMTTPDPITPEETTPDTTTQEVTTPDQITPEETTPHPTTPEVTTPYPPTQEVTTPDLITPEETTPEETTPYPPIQEVTKPDPITPEETTPDPTTPEETTPYPPTQEVTTPDPITPEETTPDPTTPVETTPDPITPEETTPDPTTPEVPTPENNHRYLLTIETWIKTQLSTSSKTM